ncbi:MAG TPA: hypothetical protein VLG47_03735 [Candidatus Saccharimonadales bacterium]|nr:hypothetical protein [Candidatus Saccharimonadales bacterium]
MQLTRVFNCFVTKDGEHFAIQNSLLNKVAGVYKLGDMAYFIDSGINYAVTVLKNSGKNSFKVNIQQV